MKSNLLVGCLALLSVTCKKTQDANCAGPELNCAGVNCFVYLYEFDFQVVDRSTGAELVFGTNPRYTTNDIKLYYDAAATQPVQLTADAGTKSFKTPFARQTMYLVVVGSSTYKAEVEFRQINCCNNEVRSLRIDGQTACICCTTSMPFFVR